ncbi:MAG: insulinase family protein, partial [Oscillospiraceae bacterium]|nr:insulinase family protein [Oscillospiraceae bacterium]
REKLVYDTLPTGAPIFNLGFKLKPRSGLEQVRAEYLASMTMQTLFDPSSAFYQEMTEKGLINSEFSVDAPFTGEGYFAVTCGGESRDPEAVRDRIFEVIEDAKKNGFDREGFELIRRVGYGSMIRGCENVEVNATRMIGAFITGIRPFSAAEILASITYEEALQFLRDEINTDNASLSVIRS